MQFQIYRDEKGVPRHVNTDDGFCMQSRPFDPQKDGWMEDQLDPEDFPAIQTGRDMEYLVAEVNRLRRALFHEKQTADIYRKAANF